jgi:hypothetical protein
LPAQGSATFAATTGAGIRMQTLPQAGTYTVRVQPNLGGAGSVQVTLWKDVTDSLTIDAPYALTILYRNQAARLTFNGTAGQNLGVNISALTLGAGGTVQVSRPDGALMGLPAAGSATFAAGTATGIPMQTVPQTGIYTVVIMPDSGAIGTAQVTVWNELVGALQVGTETVQTVRFPNQFLRFTFTGAVGDNLGLDLANLALASGGVAQGGTVQVSRPDGALIGLPAQGSATFAATTGAGIRMQTLPQAGTYTVVVMPASGATGTLKLTLWRDVPDPLTIDAPYALTILYRNQAARLIFTGVVGDNLGVDLSSVTLPGGGSIQVLRPGDGAAVVNATFTTTGGVFNVPTLGVAGTYTVVITPSSSGTGRATVRVFRR